MGVLGLLSLLCQRCHGSCLIGGTCNIRGGKGVGAGCIPNQQPPALPRDNRDAIRSLSIRTIEARWLQACWYLGCSKSSVHNVVQSGVAVMASLTPLTAEPVSGKTVHLISTVVAGVGSAQGGTQAEAHRYPNCVVIHT